MESVLNKKVSCFLSYTDLEPKTVNLLIYLQSDRYKNEVERIRKIEDKKERDKLKAKLPAISPAAILKTRSKDEKDKVSALSGLMQFDIDLKGNEHVKDWEQMKTEISKFPFVAFISLSVSGRGVWGLVPIEHPTELKFHFDSIVEDFKNIGLKLDTSKGKNPTDLRGYSFDLNAYYNHRAETYTMQVKPPKKTVNTPHEATKLTTDKTDSIDFLFNILRKAPNGEKHTTLTKVSYFLGGLTVGKKLNENDIKETLKSIIKNDWGVITYLDKNLKTLNDCFESGKLNPIDLNSKQPKELFKDWKPPQKIDNSKLKPLPPARPPQEPGTIQDQAQRFFASHNTHDNFNNVTKCYTIKKGTRHDATGWNIADIENYFTTIDLLREPFFISQGVKINDVKRFVTSHLEIIKAQAGNKTFEPYLLRLIQLKNNIELNVNH